MPGEAGFASKGREGIRLTHSCAMTQSAVLPGVRINTHGRRNASTIAWILLLRPPLVSPIA
jgi:hypothetical protein